ncbi:MAG: hypothetical protein RIQ93_3267 [Verrucomicrobiota bacterium]|jgi:hypothetical protein
MDTVFETPRRVSPSVWRECVLPREHGSWSLVFEPVALALLVAPSAGGIFLGFALAAGFLARRPFRIARIERRAERRRVATQALALILAIAVAGLGAAFFLGGASWSIWLLPMAVAGGVFLVFDLQGNGREEAAEVAGAAAYALAPAALAALAGWSPAACVALAVVMVGRSLPAVLGVRAFLRAAKTGIRHDGAAIGAALAALVATGALVQAGLAPGFALVAMLGFALRTGVLLLGRPAWRARTIGMIEATLGVGFVAGLAFAW